VYEMLLIVIVMDVRKHGPLLGGRDYVGIVFR
jgi:hypothetical protein